MSAEQRMGNNGTHTQTSRLDCAVKDMFTQSYVVLQCIAVAVVTILM